MTTQREKFESWAGCAINLSKDSDGEYWLTSTRTAWLAWREAERQMVERCAKVCEGKEYELIERDQYTVPELQTSAVSAVIECAEAIRELGAEDD